jgi:hypothetical protein
MRTSGPRDAARSTRQSVSHSTVKRGGKLPGRPPTKTVVRGRSVGLTRQGTGWRHAGPMGGIIPATVTALRANTKCTDLAAVTAATAHTVHLRARLGARGYRIHCPGRAPTVKPVHFATSTVGARPSRSDGIGWRAKWPSAPMAEALCRQAKELTPVIFRPTMSV